MFRNKCIVCNNKNLNQIIDLGVHPFADTFITKARLSSSESIYPLVCQLCKNCGNVQLKSITNPIARYDDFEYSYTSSNSKFSRSHWQSFYREISEQIEIKNKDLIIEVGSNDGYLLKQFKKNGNKVLGIDASRSMVKIANQKKIKSIQAVFQKSVSMKIKKIYGKASLVIANNVFNHADNPIDFAKSVRNLLSKEGTFIFEVPYWLIGLENEKYDQIYHEHVTYFTLRSASNILSNSGMYIYDFKVVDYHGGSLRIFAKKQSKIIDKKNKIKIDKFIKNEYQSNCFDINFYYNFSKKILFNRNKLLKKLIKIKTSGYNIIAVGAAAKGNTFLNFHKIDSSIINYVTDSSKYKQGKFTPLSRIPIVSDNIFKKYDTVYALILSWNIAKQIKQNLKKINPKIIFINIR